MFGVGEPADRGVLTPQVTGVLHLGLERGEVHIRPDRGRQRNSRLAQRFNRDRLSLQRIDCRHTVGRRHHERRGLQPSRVLCKTPPPAQEGLPALVVHHAHGSAKLREPQVRVIGPEQQTELGPRREQPVRLEATLGDQVVDHHAQIGQISANHHGFSTQRLSSGVEPGNQPLPCRLFISRRAVDLTGQEQSLDAPGLECGAKLRGLHEVVLHRIAWTNHPGGRQSRQARNNLGLHLRRKAHRQAIHVDLVDIHAFRFQMEEVPLPVGKTHHLVFEGGTVAGSDASNGAVVQRRTGHVGLHGGVSAIGRVQ